jgi:peptide/nickel transport system permease protein
MMVTPWHRFTSDWRARGAMAVLLLLVLLALAGPMLHDTSPTQLDLANPGAGASAVHPLGTDESGRDMLSRLMAGGRVSLAVGFTAMLVAVFAGTSVGALAGYRPGLADTILMRLTDAGLSIPTIFIVITVMTFLGPSAGMLIVAIGATSWMALSRLVRGELLVLREQPFVEASRALGTRDSALVMRHLMPHLVPTILVSASLGVGTAILTESALSFLGLGVQPPAASWGNMLSGSQTYLFSYPWLAVYPGLMILLTVVAVNLLGDAVRDAWQPAEHAR